MNDKERQPINILKTTYRGLQKLAEVATEKMGTPISVPRYIDLFVTEKLKELKEKK